jgi:hypothetical protein
MRKRERNDDAWLRMRSAACIPMLDRVMRPSVYGTPAADVTWTYFRPLCDDDAHGTPRAPRPRPNTRTDACARARLYTHITSRTFRAPHGRPSLVAAENRFAHTECFRRTGATRASRATAAGCTLLAEADDGREPNVFSSRRTQTETDAISTTAQWTTGKMSILHNMNIV